jgi:hypothetical protein
LVSTGLYLLSTLLENVGPSLLAPYSSLVFGLLDYIENLPFESVRQLYCILNTLAQVLQSVTRVNPISYAFKDDDPGSHRSELLIHLKKFVSSKEHKIKSIGIIGVQALVSGGGKFLHFVIEPVTVRNCRFKSCCEHD